MIDNLKRFWIKPYNKAWLLVFFMLIAGWNLIEQDTNFARLGSLIVVIALLVEVSIQWRFKYVRKVNEKSHKIMQKFNEEIAGKAAVLLTDAEAKYIEEHTDDSEKTAQINVLIMAILGTLIWGYGDYVYFWLRG